jgi:hypothetical protein
MFGWKCRCVKCEMISIAREPILVTHWNITAQCAWFLLLHQLYTATISPFVSGHSRMPHHYLLLQLMSCHCAIWSVCELSVNTSTCSTSVNIYATGSQMLPSCPVSPGMITVEISSCHHILSQVTNIQSKPSLTPFTLHTIWARYSNAYGCLYTTYRFPLPHATKLCSLNYCSITTVHLQATWKTFSHLHHSFQPTRCLQKIFHVHRE